LARELSSALVSAPLFRFPLEGLTVLGEHEESIFDFGPNQHDEIDIIHSDSPLRYPCDRMAG
jgi:hypothetical protein